MGWDVEGYSRVGGVSGGHFERIYRLFGGRAPLGHSQGWLVCHTTTLSRPALLPAGKIVAVFRGCVSPSHLLPVVVYMKQFLISVRRYFFRWGRVFGWGRY